MSDFQEKRGCPCLRLNIIPETLVKPSEITLYPALTQTFWSYQDNMKRGACLKFQSQGGQNDHFSHVYMARLKNYRCLHISVMVK